MATATATTTTHLTREPRNPRGSSGYPNQPRSSPATSHTIEAQLIVGGKLVTNGTGSTVTYQAIADPSGSINTTSVGKGNFYEFTSFLARLTNNLRTSGDRRAGKDDAFADQCEFGACRLRVERQGADEHIIGSLQPESDGFLPPAEFPLAEIEIPFHATAIFGECQDGPGVSLCGAPLSRFLLIHEVVTKTRRPLS